MKQQEILDTLYTYGYGLSGAKRKIKNPMPLEEFITSLLSIRYCGRIGDSISIFLIAHYIKIDFNKLMLLADTKNKKEILQYSIKEAYLISKFNIDYMNTEIPKEDQDVIDIEKRGKKVKYGSYKLLARDLGFENIQELDTFIEKNNEKSSIILARLLDILQSYLNRNEIPTYEEMMKEAIKEYNLLVDELKKLKQNQ